MEKVIRYLFSAIFAIFGGLIGYSFSDYIEIKQMLENLPSGVHQATTVATIVVGVLVGIALAPLVAWIVMKGIDLLARALQKFPVQEVLMGAIGLLFGLIVAFFVNLAIQTVSFASIPVIGVYTGPFIIVTSTVFLACLGAYCGSRVVFIHNLKDLLLTGGTSRRGQRIVILDSSVLIDGRIVALRDTGFLDGILIVPRFILHELQTLADSEDGLKRNRGRRGLDLLNELKKKQDLEVSDKNYEELGADAKLVRMGIEMKAWICTTDFNLAKVAAVQGVKVLNVNQLTSALKPVVMAGERIAIKIFKEGKESGQGVGYLDDGTMVVVEDGRRYIGETAEVEITSSMQTSAGKMFFSRFRNLVSQPAAAQAASQATPAEG